MMKRRRVLLIFLFWMFLLYLLNTVWSIPTAPYTGETTDILIGITVLFIFIGIVLSITFNKQLVHDDTRNTVLKKLEVEVGLFKVLNDWKITKVDRRIFVITAADELYSVHVKGADILKIEKILSN